MTRVALLLALFLSSIAGGQSRRPLSKPPPPPSSEDVWEGEDLAPVSVDASPNAMTRTKPASWSKYGWRELRWGMGGADALERLHLKPGYEVAPGTKNPRNIIVALNETLFGREIGAILNFRDAEGLIGIQLFVRERLGLGPCREWLKAARAGLEAKYGDPVSREEDSTTSRTGWRLPGTVVVAYSWPNASAPTQCVAGITYASLDDQLRLVRDSERQRDIDKL